MLGSVLLALRERGCEDASARWLDVGLLDADLAWQLECFGVTPAAYVLALDAGLRDLPSIVARYGLPGRPTCS